MDAVVMEAVAVTEWGDGDRVVLVHGSLSDARNAWKAQRPLAAGRRLVLPDRRGFGASPDVAGQDFAVDGADVAGLLPPSSHLVGHSFGAVGALLAAASQPGLVRSLVLVEPPVLNVASGHELVERFIASVTGLAATAASPAEFGRGFLVLVGVPPERIPDPLPAALVRAAMVQMRGEWPWQAEIPWDALAAAPFPKLVVSGGHSPMFELVCDEVARRLGGERAVVSSPDHRVQMVGPRFNRVLERVWAASTYRSCQSVVASR